MKRAKVVSEGNSGDAASTRTTKELRLEDLHARSRRVRELVPALGSSWHWYDVVYRSLHWCASSWRRKIIPAPLYTALVRGMNFVIPFHDLKTKKAREKDDPIYSLLVPDGESVTQGGLWVVEFFPPSHYSELQRQLRSNGWDKDGVIYREAPIAEMIAKARTGRGWLWSRIAEVRNPKKDLGPVRSLMKPLPEEFSSADISAVQIGKSVTAIVAFFEFSEGGARSLDDAWRTPREPYLVPHGFRRADVVDRRLAAIRATKAERQRLHDQARRWLERRCKGYFAATSDGQPVVDLTIFSNYDPLVRERRPRDMDDSLDALGFNEVRSWLYVSPQLPGGTFVPTDEFHRPLYGSVKNCWGFIGSTSRLQETDNNESYGPKPWSATTIAHKSDDPIRAFLLKAAAQKYLHSLQTTSGLARDSARARHGRYQASELKNLRSEMLRTSLDLHVVARDLATLWDAWHWGIEVTLQDSFDMLEGHHSPSDLDFIADLRQRQESGFKELLEEDAAYRELMATVASLGSSAEASQLGKRALAVSAVSLIVAAVTLVLADIGTASIWANTVKWWGQFVHSFFGVAL